MLVFYCSGRFGVPVIPIAQSKDYSDGSVTTDITVSLTKSI